jgi:uncharacterized damage-inducible protein DinB
MEENGLLPNRLRQQEVTMPAAHPYAQSLGDRNPLEALTETHQKITSIAAALGADGWKRSYAPGKWTAAQILAHLADSEMAFGYRIRQIISEPELPIQPFDQDNWAKHYGSMNGEQAAETFQALRAWNISLFRLLEKPELDQTAQHPERGPEKAETVIRIMAGHTLHHLAQLETIANSAAANAPA